MPSNKKVSAPKKNVVKKATDKPVEATPATDVPVVDTPVVDTPVVDTPVESTNDSINNYASEFSHLVEQLKVLQNSLKELTVYTSNLEKRIAKDQKVLNKRVNGKRKRTNTSSSPSGFSKPGPV